MLGRNTIIAASIAIGVALELGIQMVSGRREAWDSPLYWIAGLPIAGALSLVIGFLSRGRAWVWTAVIIPSQITAMMVKSGEIGILWPLAAALGAILSAPFVIAALIGSRLRKI